MLLAAAGDRSETTMLCWRGLADFPFLMPSPSFLGNLKSHRSNRSPFF